MITAAAPRVWSSAFFAAVVRYVVVGVGTGALVGLVLGALTTALGASAGGHLGVVVLFGALVGAALSLPAAAVGAVTGLVLAVRRPVRRWPVLAGLLWCPVLLVGWFTWLWMSLGGHGRPEQLTALLAAEGIVVAAVTTTQRWVTAPLVRGVGKRPHPRS